jgi:lipopolysaccharide heptosyltransferase II
LPQSRIYWWIDSSLAPLLEGDPDLEGLIRFRRRDWHRPHNFLAGWRGIRWIREQQFDWVIDLQCLARSGLLAWLASGKLTVGLDEPREGARTFYDFTVPRASYYTHAIDWYLAVLERLKVPITKDFEWLPPRADVAARVRDTWGTAGKRWILFQPGARWMNKRWPVEYYAQLLSSLAARYTGHHFAVLGGAQDTELGRGIADAAPPGRCFDLTGKLSLPEMVEWIRGSEVMVTNDTGPMHVAAALGKQIVALFGPTEPRRTGPYGQSACVLRSRLPCVPCMKPRCHYHKPLECLRSITPAAALRAVRVRPS